MTRRLFLLILLSGAVYSSNIWGTSIYVLDEARNAGCAMEMYQRNDLVVPTFNAQLRSDKPPLHYYFMQSGYALFGINPFAARIFSVIMGVLLVVAVYLFVQQLLDEPTAQLAALLLIASIQLSIQFHLAVPDPYLIFFLTFGLLAFLYAYTTGRSRYYYVCYISLGLATLAKGPVAIVFSGLIVLIFLICQKNFSWSTLLKIKLIPGTLLFLLIVLPWYVTVGIYTNGEWLEEFFLKHNVNRFTSSMEGHGGFPFASFFIVLGGLIPFSLFFPQAFRYAWKMQRTNPIVQFCGIAMAVVVLFFAFSRTILPSYPEPALPFFAILLSAFFQQIIRSNTVRDYKLHINAWIYLIITIAVPFAVYFGLRAERELANEAWVAWYFVMLPVGAAWGLWELRRANLMNTLYIYAGSCLLCSVIFFYLAFPPIDKNNPVTKGYTLLVKTQKPIVHYRIFNPAFVFKLQRPIKGFSEATALETYLKETDGAHVITQKRYLKDLVQLPLDTAYMGKDLFESQTTVILTY